jgi:hypothetical protein
MSEQSHTCLNCSQKLFGNFCANCGQKADTHRITPKHFIAHDLVHGVFHIDRGLFYTVKQVFRGRGKSALEYLNGKRVQYYNVFYLSLLLLGLNILVVVTTHRWYPESQIHSSGDMRNLMDLLSNNIKYLILGFIPVMAFLGFLMFRKRKHNYAEHMVVAGFCMVGCLILSLLRYGWALLVHSDHLAFQIIGLVLAVLPWLFPVVFYYSYARPVISTWGYIWRILVFYCLLFTIFFAVILISAAVAANGTTLEGELFF